MSIDYVEYFLLLVLCSRHIWSRSTFALSFEIKYSSPFWKCLHFGSILPSVLGWGVHKIKSFHKIRFAMINGLTVRQLRPTFDFPQVSRRPRSWVRVWPTVGGKAQLSRKVAPAQALVVPTIDFIADRSRLQMIVWKWMVRICYGRLLPRCVKRTWDEGDGYWAISLLPPSDWNKYWPQKPEVVKTSWERLCLNL